MKKSLLLFLLIPSFISVSQNTYNSNDLTVTKPELITRNFDKDSTANALIIYEYGNSYVDKNTFKLITEVKKKLKIINRKGFDYATVSLYLYTDGSRKERVSNITATTYNIENDNVTRTQLEDSQIFEEKYNDKYSIVKFTFPNIQEGSVITYSYKLETPFMYKYREWFFQEDIPKLFSQYKTSIPANYEYNIKLVGFLKLDTNDHNVVKNCIEGSRGASADCFTTNYIIKDIPAFVEEEFMTTKSNYLSRVEYELKTFQGFDGTINHYTKTWKTVDSELKSDKDIGKQLNKSGVVKGLLGESIINEKDPLIKAKAILRYVQETYTWNGKYDIFQDVSIKNLVENKSGNISEINILLYNLLDEYGIDVKPVLMSTRTNGLATKIFPVLSDFNYLLVQSNIGGKSYLLDATDKYIAFGQVPFRCLNQYGRLLDFKKGSYWIDINAELNSYQHYRIELDLNSEAVLNGSVVKKSTGYQANPLKQRFFENQEEYTKLCKDKYPTIEFLNYNVTTKDKTDYEFVEEFEIKHQLDIPGDKIYLNPYLFKFFSENMFKLQDRTYPIDFGYKDSFLYTLKLNFDDSYTVLEIPQDMILRLPNGTGTLNTNNKIENNTVELYFKLSFNEAIYTPDYYDSIKKFLERIVDIQNNSLIVLQKK
ncbi:MAG: hypothetical protein ACSHXF_14085 [Aquaticitalea sp.]